LYTIYHFLIEPTKLVFLYTSEVYVLENYEFTLQLVITTNKIEKKLDSVNAELIDVKFH